jgi:hypothetical protein
LAAVLIQRLALIVEAAHVLTDRAALVIVLFRAGLWPTWSYIPNPIKHTGIGHQMLIAIELNGHL